MAPRKAFPLRLDPRLYEDLRRWAEQELRSVNAQIEFLLRDAVERKYRRVREQHGTDARGGSEEDSQGTSHEPPDGSGGGSGPEEGGDA